MERVFWYRKRLICLYIVSDSIINIKNKNHSEKVYFFGVVFHYAILPYFTDFARGFFGIFCTSCTKDRGFSKSILFENSSKC